VKKRFTEEQIIGFPHEAESGLRLADLCSRNSFPEASDYLWHNKFGGMSVFEAKRLWLSRCLRTRWRKQP